jgi:hypothetical protein
VAEKDEATQHRRRNTIISSLRAKHRYVHRPRDGTESERLTTV